MIVLFDAEDPDHSVGIDPGDRLGEPVDVGEDGYDGGQAECQDDHCHERLQRHAAHPVSHGAQRVLHGGSPVSQTVTNQQGGPQATVDERFGVLVPSFTFSR